MVPENSVRPQNQQDTGETLSHCYMDEFWYGESEGAPEFLGTTAYAIIADDTARFTRILSPTSSTLLSCVSRWLTLLERRLSLKCDFAGSLLHGYFDGELSAFRTVEILRLLRR